MLQSRAILISPTFSFPAPDRYIQPVALPQTNNASEHKKVLWYQFAST